MLAICDAKYCFTYVDFGQYGNTRAFEENKFNVPAPTEAEGFEDPLPYFLLGNKIFPHKTWLMRPFPGSLDDSQKNSITDFPGLGKQSQMHLVFW